MGINKLWGAGGFKAISGTGAKTSVNACQIVINSDAVFTVLAGGGSPNSTSTNYFTQCELSGLTLAAGMILTPDPGETFNSITLASGSILVYFEPANGEV
jgi:hypothetical protein